jgi:DNA polymerase-3 subunit alpha
MYGLGAIKGVGESAIEAILAERESGGRFKDLFDLCRRVDLRKANRRVLEALIRAGALDGLGPGRSAMVASLDKALMMAEQHGKNAAAGQEDLFGLGPLDGEDPAGDPAAVFESTPEWSDEARLAGEKDTLGLYLTGHPIDRYDADLNALVSCRLVDLKPGKLSVGGLVIGLRFNQSKRGRMAIATLDDRTARAEVVVYAETLLKYAEVLAKDKILVVEGTCNVDEFSGGHSLVAERIYDIEAAREISAKRLVLQVDSARAANGFAAELREILEPHRPGPCPVVIDYCRPDASARLTLGEPWRVRPSDEMLARLKTVLGEEGVRLEY